MGVRERFIQETLEGEGQRMLRNQGAAIGGTLARRSGRLLSARTVTVSGGEEMDGRLAFEHPAYERFLDMRRLRRGPSEVKPKRRRKIHNRFVFGAYAAIARRLMYGFTEDVAQRIREEFGK